MGRQSVGWRWSYRDEVTTMTPAQITAAAAARARTPRAARIALGLPWLAATVAHLPGLQAVTFVTRMAETAATRPVGLRSAERVAIEAEIAAFVEDEDRVTAPPMGGAKGDL
jgi:hypothetical protein